jgi:hypothetical protein
MECDVTPDIDAMNHHELDVCARDSIVQQVFKGWALVLNDNEPVFKIPFHVTHPSSPQSRFDGSCHLLTHGRQDVGVHVHRERCGCVAQGLGYDLRVNAADE